MKLRDTLSATLLAHADAPRRWKTPLSPDPAKAYPLWLLALRTFLWAALITSLVGLLIRAGSGKWSLFLWPFWWIVSIGVVWGGMTVFAWNRRAARVRAAAAAGQLAPVTERLPVWSRLSVVPLYYLLFFFITPLVLALTVANQISARKWANYRAELVARGVTLDLMAMVPKPVPDAENFATTPLFKDLGFSGDAMRSPAGEAARARLEKFSLPASAQESTPPWLMQKWIDLGGYRAGFTNAALFPQGDVASSDAAAVLAALKAWDAELREIEGAASRPAMAFPVRYQDSFSALLPHLSHIKSLATIYRLRAAARLASSDASGALQDIKTGWRLGNFSASEPFLVSYLVGAAIDGAMTQPIWEGLQAKSWNDAQLAELDALLASRDYDALSRRAINGERAASSTLMEQLLADPAELDRASGILNGGESSGAVRMVSKLPASFFIFENLIAQNRWYDEVLPRDGSSPDFREAHQGIERLLATPWHPSDALVRVFFPALGNVFLGAARVEARQSLARTAIALERHHLANGSYPDTLAALTPKFLPTALNDPFSKAPLHYSKTTDGRYLLYSVGRNGTDDKGHSTKRARSNNAYRGPESKDASNEADDIAWTYLPLEK